MISARSIDEIATAFRSRWIQGYVRGKLRRDPVYDAAYDALAGSSLPLLDMGCGMGLLPLYLSARGAGAAGRGFDFDERKIALANEAAARTKSKFEFSIGDVRQPVDFTGNVALLDVLHYFKNEEQKAILRNAAAAVCQGGILVIRDCLREDTLRFRITWVQETFSKLIGWLRSEQLNFPTRELIENELVSHGLTLVECRPLWKNTPFNNYFLSFTRK